MEETDSVLSSAYSDVACPSRQRVRTGSGFVLALPNFPSDHVSQPDESGPLNYAERIQILLLYLCDISCTSIVVETMRKGRERERFPIFPVTVAQVPGSEQSFFLYHLVQSVNTIMTRRSRMKKVSFLHTELNSNLKLN